MKKRNHCNFQDHKSHDRRCAKCGYEIPKTINDDIALKSIISYTGESPECSKGKLLIL